MNSRERVLAAINHRLADRIPIDAIHIEIQPELAAALRCDPAEVLDTLGLDGRIVAAPYRGELPPSRDGAPCTPWGVPDTGDYGTAHTYPLADIDSVQAVEAYVWPNPDLYDYATAAQQARSWGQRYAVRGPYWEPIFSRACDLMGMQQAMVCMLVEPLLFDAVLEHIYLRVASISAHLLDACGDDMPIYCLGDDFATQRGLMISPEKWRRFVRPRLAGLFALAKARGKKVWFHSCGDITAVLPDLIEIGMDVWETVQLHTLPMSAQELKRTYGRDITFFGGVNTQRLPFAQPDEIEDEVAHVIEALAAGGGYICGPDHHIKPDVPVENALALFAAARAFRRDGYTLSGR
jgi:uroporphyrinogen decarboxylase